MDREFETECAPVRELLEALKLGTLEELARAAADYRGVLARVREVEHELDGLRASAGEGVAEEIRRLALPDDLPMNELASNLGMILRWGR